MRRLRLVVAGLLFASIAYMPADAFIFRRMRSRISSGRGAFASRQSRGMRSMFTRNRTRSSSGSYSPRWNVNGQWSYNDDYIADHLRTVHKINVEGFSRDQMEKIHDNMHNGNAVMSGVVALGGSPCASCPLAGGCPNCVPPAQQEEVVVVEELVVEAPAASSSSGCPNGRCPTSSGSSSTRRRGLFRRW